MPRRPTKPQPMPPEPRKFSLSHPCALIIGRFQPFHLGHKALADEALRVHEAVCFGIRVMPFSPRDPYHPIDVWTRIQKLMEEYESWRVGHILVPNLTAVVYGRDVGYEITEVKLPPGLEAIRATDIRARSKPTP